MIDKKEFHKQDCYERIYMMNELTKPCEYTNKYGFDAVDRIVPAPKGIFHYGKKFVCVSTGIGRQPTQNENGTYVLDEATDNHYTYVHVRNVDDGWWTGRGQNMILQKCQEQFEKLNQKIESAYEGKSSFIEFDELNDICEDIGMYLDR